MSSSMLQGSQLQSPSQLKLSGPSHGDLAYHLCAFRRSQGAHMIMTFGSLALQSFDTWVLGCISHLRETFGLEARLDAQHVPSPQNIESMPEPSASHAAGTIQKAMADQQKQVS